ncbi:hypothetical protein [uncultured Nevskia sp.]|uniref:hypothetical protein n=1 Tax=uncultured Nevskia sp. TaxID=228950 RepID=UPI0025F1003B|nr:hypothetical protein [uncultured Nevskia sp.]
MNPDNSHQQSADIPTVGVEEASTSTPETSVTGVLSRFKYPFQQILAADIPVFPGLAAAFIENGTLSAPALPIVCDQQAFYGVGK